MPLKKGKSKMAYNFHELYEDNKKEGKERGRKGRPRTKEEIIAIALSMAGKSKKTNKRKK